MRDDVGPMVVAAHPGRSTGGGKPCRCGQGLFLAGSFPTRKPQANRQARPPAAAIAKRVEWRDRGGYSIRDRISRVSPDRNPRPARSRGRSGHALFAEASTTSEIRVTTWDWAELGSLNSWPLFFESRFLLGLPRPTSISSRADLFCTQYDGEVREGSPNPGMIPIVRGLAESRPKGPATITVGRTLPISRDGRPNQRAPSSLTGATSRCLILNREDLQRRGRPSDPLVEALLQARRAGGRGRRLAGRTLGRPSNAQGVTRWGGSSRPRGGEGCDRMTLLKRYARVAEGSLTAAFILSQHDAAVRRLVAASDRPIAFAWLQKIEAGVRFPTVGISQLTTSRRHGDQAVRAEEFEPGRFRVDGLIPWVTAASRADMLVAGAATLDGRQILFALPTDRPGVVVKPPFALAALQASCTAEVACEAVLVEADDLLAGPSTDVMANPAASGTGGLETSALALGPIARRGSRPLEAAGREDLIEPVEALRESWERLRDDLMACASGSSRLADAGDRPRSGQRPGPPAHAGLSHGSQGLRLPPRGPRPALGPTGPLLPRLVLPEPRRPGRHPRPCGALLELIGRDREWSMGRRGDRTRGFPPAFASLRLFIHLLVVRAKRENLVSRPLPGQHPRLGEEAASEDQGGQGQHGDPLANAEAEGDRRDVSSLFGVSRRNPLRGKGRIFD